MSIQRWFLAAFAIVISVAAVLAGPARANDDIRYYLSLGDSLAQGYQPIGGPSSPLGFPGYNQGYADQLLKLARDPGGHLQLVKLGCGGETTTTMLAGAPWCGFAAGSQLAEATRFLRAHRGDIAFVTIDIGGNDLIQSGAAAAAVQANLPKILHELRDAAGPSVPIVGMTSYNPFLADSFANPTALEDHNDALAGFNDLLESLYAAAGDPVAGVENAFATSDTTPVDGVPRDVARLCAWAWNCTQPPHGPDIHPNDAGYAAIAQAFDAVLP